MKLLIENWRKFISEGFSMDDIAWVKEWRKQLPDIIRKAGGKLHQGDLLDYGLKGVDINNFMGMIKMDPAVGELDDGTVIRQDYNYLMIED
tara:strand:+ start:502 stop:774 length:273 start_codon:yes stop_codon:yes gene_type:complete